MHGVARGGGREGKGKLTTVMAVAKQQLDPSLDDRAHHETFVNQSNVSPITGFVRHTMKLFFVCLTKPVMGETLH